MIPVLGKNKGEISYEEAVARYITGDIRQMEAATLCGLSVSGFSKRLKADHINAIEASKSYRAKHRVISVPKHERMNIENYEEKIRKTMRRIHSVTLDEKIAKARQAGISYGRYVAMMKVGVMA